MSTSTRDVVIVGGGVAGMAAAWQLRDMDIALLDENEVLGGRMKSVPRGDYWLNLGGHIFPADEASHIRRMIADLGLGTMDITGSKTAMSFGGKVYAARRIEAYPFTLPLSLGERVQLAIAGLKVRWKVRSYRSVSRTRPGVSEAERRARVSRFEAHRTFRDLLGRLPAKVDSIFQTAARRSPAEMEQLSAGAGILLFAGNWDSKAGALVNLRGGSGRIGEALARRLGERVILGAKVISVEPDGDGALVRYDTADGRSTISARRVIVATPAPVTLSLLRGLPPAVETSLRSVTYGPFVCMAALTSESGPMPWDHLYAILTPGMAFNMLFNHANPLRDGPRVAGGTMMCYAGGRPGLEMLGLPDDEIVRRFKEDLDRVFPGLTGLITETAVQRWPLGNCWRTPGTNLDAVLAYSAQESNVIQLAGDYFGELGGSIEDATRSGMEAAGRVAAALGRTSEAPQ